MVYFSSGGDCREEAKDGFSRIGFVTSNARIAAHIVGGRKSGRSRKVSGERKWAESEGSKGLST